MSSKLARAITRLPDGYYVRLERLDWPSLCLSLWRCEIPADKSIFEKFFDTSDPWAKQFAQLLEQWMEEEEKR